MQIPSNSTVNSTALYTLPLRWVIGWTYFSAFWRRLILDNKLIPEEAGYIGEKFNHFLPNALGIKPIIEWLVTHPEHLQTSMIAFTIIEAIVGIFLIFGIFTRLMSIGVFFLALGILLGSGWLGTTCLDEWQIGVLGISSGAVLFFSGADKYSVDYYLTYKNFKFTKTKWFRNFALGPINLKKIEGIFLSISMLILALTLYTNQYFHGGVFGPLHNKSVKPKLELSNAILKDNKLSFQIYRVEGADVYGSFLIGIDLIDVDDNIIKTINQTDLANLNELNIRNHYVAKIKPGKHSLIIPLGAKADINIELEKEVLLKLKTISLTDISGIQWRIDL